MRSYEQKCALAKALDVVGDRWTLLIVRELLIRGPCRYTDVKNGLPGIAPNLLSERLRELEKAGIIVCREAPPPVATRLFQLSQRGQALEPAILHLGLWGAPLLASARRRDVLQPHWIVLPLRHYLVDATPQAPDATIEVRAENEVIAISVARGTIDVRLGSPSRPDAVVAGKADPILLLLSGKLSLPAAQAAGVAVEGAVDTVDRVIPREQKTARTTSRTSFDPTSS